MGSPSGFDVLAQAAPAAAQQQRAIKEQQRVQQQNTVGAQLLDAINNAGNIKPQTKDENGNIIHNPEYDTAQQAKTKLLQQYTQLNSPEQHASFADHLHGLIFGHPDQRTQQPALSPNSSPNEPPAPAVAPGQDSTSSAAPAPLHPMAPAPANHPLHTITQGIKTLGEGLKNHAQAFANPLPPQQNPIDPALIAKYQRDPGEVQAERNQALWGVRGQNALDLQDKKNEYLKTMLQARPPRLLSQTTIPDLLQQMKIDPSMNIYGPNGQELSPAQLSELPAGTIAREFRAGSQIFYALGDQNSKTLKVGNEVYDIPSVGPINAGNSTAIGVANPGGSTVSTDQYGNTTASARAVPTPGMAAGAPPAASGPVLQTRPPNPLSAVNASIAAANASSKTLNKGKPVSSQAPQIPGPRTLDDNGNIPDSAGGNPQVRQFANDLINDRDTDKIPAKARASAEALASQFGWSQGAFTPREMKQMLVSQNFLQQLQSSPALKALDSYVDRVAIEKAMDNSTGLIKQAVVMNLPKEAAEFIRLFNSAAGSIQGLSSVTRQGRATQGIVNLLRAELPNVLQSSSSSDAKDRISQLLKEVNLAQQKNSTLRTTNATSSPVSKNAPALGAWKPPADAPPAPKEDNKVLKADGKVIAVSKGGQWAQP